MMFDVVVIGAGLSGLQAAYTAQKAGFSVVVVEARERVGGKVWTVPLTRGKGYVDLGATWVNATLQPRVWAYIERFGLRTVEQRLEGTAVLQQQDGSRSTFPFGTTPSLSSTERENFESIRDDLQRKSLSPVNISEEEDAVSLDEYVRNKGACESSAMIVNTWSRVMHGVESTEQSAAWFLDYCRRNRGLLAIRADDATGGQHLRMHGGAQAIAQGMARLIGARNICLGSPVRYIQDQKTHVRVVTVQGTTYRGRKCILSVPSTMYRELSFTPALPSICSDVAHRTILGDYNKVIACYHTPWWREQGFNGYFLSFQGPICVARDTSVDEISMYALTCFVNGEAGRLWSKLPPYERRSQVLDQIAAVFAVSRESEAYHPIEMFDQIWQHEEFSRGALAPITARGDLLDYISACGQRVGNLDFTGTEFSPEWKGYMEGALCSGEQVGASVVAEMRSQALPRL